MSLPGKIVCVGRNYADHARELGNAVPTRPLLFMKPASAIQPLSGTIHIPADQGLVHHELELALRIGSNGAVDAWTLALDLTLRELQGRLKEKGHPWERAKAFAGSCPLGPWQSIDGVALQALDLTLRRNGEVQQDGNTRDMLFAIPQLLEEAGSAFGLQAGDILLTGTPAGVGPLEAGDSLALQAGALRLEALVAIG